MNDLCPYAVPGLAEIEEKQECCFHAGTMVQKLAYGDIELLITGNSQRLKDHGYWLTPDGGVLTSAVLWVTRTL